MQNFLLIEDEIIQTRIGSIQLTNRRIVQSRGKGNSFKVASIPTNKSDTPSACDRVVH